MLNDAVASNCNSTDGRIVTASRPIGMTSGAASSGALISGTLNSASRVSGQVASTTPATPSSPNSTSCMYLTSGVPYAFCSMRIANSTPAVKCAKHDTHVAVPDNNAPSFGKSIGLAASRVFASKLKLIASNCSIALASASAESRFLASSMASACVRLPGECKKSTSIESTSDSGLPTGTRRGAPVRASTAEICATHI
jgi:hypothetical protein